MTLTLLNNRYQVLQVLGSGGFGETFLAQDTQMPSHKRCVIKKLRPLINNPQMYQLVQERFQKEAAILEDLGDRNSQIPRLYAYFSEGGEFYLVQEYIEGQTLTEKFQQQGVLNEITVKEIVINILQILEFVHSKGIVHRDIKPDNIIWRLTDNKPVLIDFGAVKVTMNTAMSPSGNPTQSIVIGTPGFMPMEQSVGRPVFASDIYSLGLTAIFLLTGKYPQDLPTEPTTGNILWRHCAPYLSVSFGDILDKAIACHQGDRYPTAKEMLMALQTPISANIPGNISTILPIQPLIPSTPTVIAAPATTSQYIPPQQPSITSHPTQYPNYPNNGLGTWQQAVIIGGVIGTILVGGLWVLGIVNKPQEITTNTSNSPQQVTSPTPSNSNTSTTNTSTTNTSTTNTISNPVNSPPIAIQTQTTNSISQEAAVQVLQKWLAAKRQIFGPPYSKELGYQLLTGPVYTKFITKTDDPDACLARTNNEDDCLSSVDWLVRNGAYWVYGVQKIQSVRNFVSSGDNATIVVVVTEQRTLYSRNGNVDRTLSGMFTSTTSYDLQYENGEIKIYNYK